MNKYTVTEGNTGVLELVDEQGNKDIYQPNCDLDKAQALLYEFYELGTTTDGTKVKDAFQRNGIDWFPTAVSQLYWGFLWQFIKYKPLAEAWIKGEKDFVCNSPGKFANLICSMKMSLGLQFLTGRDTLKKIYYALIQRRNRFVVRKRGDILFFRYGVNDFKTNELYGDLRKRYQVTLVTGVTVRELVRHVFNSQIYILADRSPLPSFKNSLPDDTPEIHKMALCYAQNVINTHLMAYQSHSNLVRHFSYKLFFGLDDANHVYPVLYAAQDVGMKTLGFQHCCYERRHVAYIMHGIEHYRWYDNVLVWGGYWKDVILRHSSIFSENFHILASNKHTYDYTLLPKKRKEKTILIPYEFLSDSVDVGQYIRRFIAKGFYVYFKPRSDELLEDQLQAYYLGEDRDKIEIVETISPDVMAEIDVIAGTQTTLLFDLLPYRKPVWILETSFRLMYDMVENGFARLIKKEDMERIDEIYQEEIMQKRTIDPTYISGSKPVTEAIEEYLTAGRQTSA